jgi:hypothetical protein
VSIYLLRSRRISSTLMATAGGVGEVVAAVMEHPVGTVLNPDRWVCWWGEWHSGQPRDLCHRPHHCIYSTGDRGPPTRCGWAPPIRARTRSRVRVRAVGLGREEIILTFSPLISTFLLTLYFHFIHFILDQYIGHVSSSQLYCR